MLGALSQFHVLIVDDSAHIRRLVIAMLRCYGCTQISEARTAQQALLKFSTSRQWWILH